MGVTFPPCLYAAVWDVIAGPLEDHIRVTAGGEIHSGADGPAQLPGLGLAVCLDVAELQHMPDSVIGSHELTVDRAPGVGIILTVLLE